MKLSESGGGGIAGRSTRVESIQKIMQIDGLTAIDLGSNEGYNCFDLFEAGCREVVGIEIRDRYLASAEQERIKLGYQHIQFLKKDVRKIDELGLGKFDLCLCTGLLYHMQNPFNLLKRLRNICNVLVLETHISPSIFQFFMARKKYRCNLSLLKHSIRLDNEVFEGRLNIFPASTNMDDTSGSVVSSATFWPDKQSLLKALHLAGFRLRVLYFSKTPNGFPAISVDHGYRRTKVFLVADVIDVNTHIPVEEGNIVGCHLLAANSL
jgi:SAM-dependent methyltransferase